MFDRSAFAKVAVPLTKASMLYYLAIAVLGVWLIHASKSIGFMNQGDFARSIRFILGQPIDQLAIAAAGPTGYIWTFREEMGGPRLSTGTSAALFWLMAKLQRLYANYFDVFTMALLAKIYLLFMSNILAGQFGKMLKTGLAGRLAIFSAFAIVFFCAHNVALFNSFYTEYAFFLATPMLLAAAMCDSATNRRRVYVVAALLAGGAKVQFFYVPALLLSALFVHDRVTGRPADLRLIVLLIAVQLACLIPLRKTEFTALNYYHSTYLGSYAVMTDEELSTVGIDADKRRCILVDAWGNKLPSASALTFTPGNDICVRRHEQHLSDVLSPYAKFPAVAIRLWQDATPPHFTVNYFHLTKALPYLIPTDGKSFKSGQWLIAVSELRDQIVSRYVMLVIALTGLVLPFLRMRTVENPLRSISLFLSVFCVSQVVVCVVGEGVRDLSRHLSAAQYAVDILFVLCVMQALLLVRSSRNAKNKSAATIA